MTLGIRISVSVCFLTYWFVYMCVCTVSEPSLKWKLKKLLSSRPNPLQRKISAPPAVKHRTENLGTVPSSLSGTLMIQVYADLICHFYFCYFVILYVISIRTVSDTVWFNCMNTSVLTISYHELMGVFDFCHADSSTSSSSNPASGCSSPNDSLHSDNGHLPLAHEVSLVWYLLIADFLNRIYI